MGVLNINYNTERFAIRHFLYSRHFKCISLWLNYKKTCLKNTMQELYINALLSNPVINVKSYVQANLLDPFFH